MIGFGWMGGLFLERLSSTNLKRFFAATLAGFLSFLTWFQIPVWKSELALWENAVGNAPKAWFAWACYGDAARGMSKKAGGSEPNQRRRWCELSEFSLDQALRNGPPVESAGPLLLLLAETKLDLGKKEEGRRLGERAVQLDPDLTDAWKKMRW